ncbi:hypothetical protein [Myroides indicus]|uniref:AhpC/TSA family protein n=1 Tax=Myroides indicus TaxID=1323422 RepID=A0A4R7EWC4_9FLAO|nr:hypothetical protein [Myroides indicus]TDS58207.1 hypothetical protein C8P70_11238 [Myroides indicus]
MKKFLKITGISIISLLLLLIAFVYFFVNNENINYQTQMSTITHPTVQEHMADKPFVLFVLSSTCGGVDSEEGMKWIKKDIEMCKENKIDYLIVFDDLHCYSMDDRIKEFAERRDFKESFYFIDPLAYKENIKIIDQGRRMKDFLSNLIPDVSVVGGYPQYFYFEKGIYKGNSFGYLDKGVKKFFNMDLIYN